MAKEAIIRQKTVDYNIAVQTIKEAILRSQYQAAKLVNREMLSLYYGIGRYVSANSRKGFWGTNAIETISERLRKELPGLKGFSTTSIKKMRQFYEQWEPVISKSTAWRSIYQSQLMGLKSIHCSVLFRPPRRSISIWKNF